MNQPLVSCQHVRSVAHILTFLAHVLVSCSPRLPLTQAHLGRVGEERCAYIRALVIVNQALMSRQHLEEQAQNWLAEAGTTPPGNGIDRSDWEVCIAPPCWSEHRDCPALSDIDWRVFRMASYTPLQLVTELFNRGINLAQIIVRCEGNYQKRV